jgi:sulfite exporter TauE/SafE
MSIIIALFLTGILFGSGPCLLSCGPVLISYICGTNKRMRDSLGTYTLFSASRIGVYIILSLVIFFIGKTAFQTLIEDYGKYLYIVAGFFLVLIGIYFIIGKRMELKPFNLIYQHIIKGDTKNVVVLGIAYGILPCAPFLGVLSYIGLVSNNWLQNVAYAAAFGAGTFISALLLVSLAAGAIPGLMKKNNGLIPKIVRVLCGIIALYMGSQLAGRAFQ